MNSLDEGTNSLQQYRKKFMTNSVEKMHVGAYSWSLIPWHLHQHQTVPNYRCAPWLAGK